MKKLLGIVVLVLVWCNISNAAIYKGESSEAKEREKDCLASGKTKSACKKEVYGWGLNDYLKVGYKISSENFVNNKGWMVTIFVLKKKGTVVTCMVDHNKQKTTCREP